MTKFKIDKGTEFEANGVKVTALEDLPLKSELEIDALAEQAHIGRLPVDFSHTETIDGEKVAVTYGAAAKRIETPVEEEKADKKAK